MKPSTLNQCVYEYYNAHWNKGKKTIVDHFLDENVPKSTIYDIIKRWERGLPAERKKRSGWKPKIMMQKNSKRLKEK